MAVELTSILSETILYDSETTALAEKAGERLQGVKHHDNIRRPALTFQSQRRGSVIQSVEMGFEQHPLPIR